MGQYGQPCQKPEPRKRVKGRRQRHASAVVQDIRAQVVARDGSCRIGNTTTLLGPCEGPSEWMHLGESRRHKTRGMAPEVRHTTAGTCMGCQRHHTLYDWHQMTIEALSERGADSTLRLRMDGVSVLSVPPVRSE